MILENATFHTGDPVLARASALAIAGGKVLGGVDSREDAIASHIHEHIDLQGAHVYPGFVDAHVHIANYTLSRERLDLASIGSPQELAAAIARETDPTVRGHGLANRVVEEIAEDPAHQKALAQAADGRPVALTSYDGHSLVTTQATLAALGISRDSLDLQYVYVHRDGSFSGVLKETAGWAVRRALPDDDLTVAGANKALRHIAAQGFTGIHDFDGSRGFSLMQAVDRERGLPIRVTSYFYRDDLAHLTSLGIASGFGSDRLRVGGVKLFADGTFSSGTAWMLDPQACGGQDHGLLTEAEMIEIIAEAADAGLQVAIHAIGDGAVRAATQAFVATHDHWQHLPGVPRVEHAQLVRADDLTLCAKFGIALSVQPIHLLVDSDSAEQALPPERLADVHAWRQMLDAGCLVATGSDAPIEQPSLVETLRSATTRQYRDMKTPWYAEQAMDAGEAVLAGAQIPHLLTGQTDCGKLTPGMSADLVVLSGDPEAEEHVSVVATMVGGRFVHGRQQLAVR